MAASVSQQACVCVDSLSHGCVCDASTLSAEASE